MISESIADLLTKQKELSGIKKKLIAHGIDILICDGRNFLCVLLLSLFLHRFTDAVVFIILLSALRSRTGGWHADTPNKCFLFYQASFLLFCLFTAYQRFSVYHIMMVLSSLYILINAPVEHVFNPLSPEEWCLNRKDAIRMTILCDALYCCFVYYDIDLFKSFATVFFFDMILMICLKYSKNRRKHESNMRCR